MFGNPFSMTSRQWVLDSGASHHMTPLISLLEDVNDISHLFSITMPNGDTVLINKIGKVNLGCNIILHDVLYIL